MKNPNLPEEIVLEIFTRLPSRSIGRCRCLSKLWRSQLSNSQFLNLHFTRKPQNETLLFLSPKFRVYKDDNLPPIVSIYTIDLPIDLPIKYEAFSKKLNMQNSLVEEVRSRNGLVLMLNNWFEVVGSCNGLVLLLDKKDRMFLVNPITKEQVSIPDPPGYHRSHPPYQSSGFGFDIVNLDYKIVSIRDSRKGIDNVTTVDVYSVKTGVWISKHNFPSRLRIRYSASGALLNGGLHWCVSDFEFQESSIVNFDLATEEFLIIPGPTGFNTYKYYNAYVLEGHLCVVKKVHKSSSTDVIDAWIMKEYGVKESWINISLCVDGLRLGSSSLKPLCYVGEGDDKGVLVNLRNMLFVCNLKEQKKSILVDGGVTAFREGCVFVESLVSPGQLFLD